MQQQPAQYQVLIHSKDLRITAPVGAIRGASLTFEQARKITECLNAAFDGGGHELWAAFNPEGA